MYSSPNALNSEEDFINALFDNPLYTDPDIVGDTEELVEIPEFKKYLKQLIK